jgi:uncharacterized membrane protein
MFILPPKLTVRDISVICILTAVCIASNYALVGLPNVKIMDITVFASGYVFGSLVGAIIGALSWVIYGFINPFGFNLPIWLATIVSEALFGLIGGWISSVRKNKPVNEVFKFNFEMALWGFTLTIVYDLFTNIMFAYSFGISLTYALVSGWLIPPWFSIMHELSNTVLFFIAVYPLIKAIERAKGSDSHGQ